MILSVLRRTCALPLLLAVFWARFASDGLLVGQEAAAVDYSVLSEPGIANRLGLTDEQRASVATILDARLQKLITAKAEERPAILAESNTALAQLLSDEQKTTLTGLLAAGKLRFNFRQQKWPDVLDWFARQGDLSLVMDTAPPGLFTYSDSRDYSPAEAIDLLNSVLQSKGFTLLRKEKMLIVVDVSQGIPFEMAPRVAVTELDSRGRFEIVTIEIPLGGRNVDACLSAVKELVGSHGRVTPLASVGKLLVTESAGKLKAINEVVSGIPVPQPPPPPPPPPPKPPEPVFAVYAAKGLDPAATVETLEGLFKSASIKADPKAEEIHAYAIPAIQEAIKVSIEKMLANVSGDKRARLAIYPVDVKDLTSIVSQLTKTLPDVQVTPDAGGRRLLVFANVERQAEVQDALEKLGASSKAPEGDVSVAIYPVKGESVEGLTKLLTDVLPRAMVIAQGGRIAVRGTAEDHRIAQATIEQFQKSELKPEPPALTFHPLDKPLDASLLSAIQKMVPGATIASLDGGKRLSVLAKAEDQIRVEAALAQIASNLPQAAEETLEVYRPERLSVAEFQSLLASVAPDAKVRVDLSGQRLIVWATAAVHERIASTLTQVGEKLAPEKPTLETYEVSSSEATAILAAAQALAPSAQSRLDATSRRLVVIGTSADHQLVKELVDKLRPTDTTNEKVLVAYPLSKGDAAALVTMLQPLRPDVQFAADPRANRILVTAPLREQARLRAVIEQLDAAPAEGREGIVKPYALKMLAPTVVVDLLQPLVPKLKLSVDTPNRRLIAVGTEIDHQKLDTLLARLDGDGAGGARVESYDIADADPTQVRSVLLQLVPTAVVSSTAVAKRLMVWATEAEHAAIRQAIEQFTQNADSQARELRTYPVPKSIGASALTIVKAIVPDSTLSLDTSGDRMIAWATADEHLKIASAMDQLGKSRPNRANVVLRMHRAAADLLRNAVPLLPDIAPEARLVPTTDTDRWLVWAVEEEHKAIEAMLADLNGLAPLADKIVTVYAIKDPRLTAQTVADSLDTELTKDAVVRVSTTANSLIVRATEAAHAKLKPAIEAIITQLPPPPVPDVQVFRLRRGIPSSVAITLRTMAPASTIVADDTAGTLAITASPEDMDRIRRMIEQIQATATDARQTTKAYPLNDVDPAIAKQVVAARVPKATVLTSTDTSRLLIVGGAEDHATIEGMLADLGGLTPSAGKTVAVYPIKDLRLTAQTVADALDTALTQDAVVRVSTTANSLVIRATDETHAKLKQAIETIIAQLPPPTVPDSHVFRFQRGTPSSALIVLRTLAPAASIAADDIAGTLAVTASTEDLERIRKVVEQIQATVTDARQTTKAYPLNGVDPAIAKQVVAARVPKATVLTSTDTSRLLIVGGAEDHATIDAMLADLGGLTPSAGKTVAVYPIKDLRLAAQTVADALDTALTQDAVVRVSTTANSLVIRATDETHAKLKQAIETIIAQLPPPTVPDSHVFRFQRGTPSSALIVLRTLAPAASIAADDIAGTLAVTASTEDLERIRKVVEQIQATATDARLTTRVYKFRKAAARSAFTAFTQLAPKARLAFDDTANVVVATASDEDHAAFQEATTQIDGEPIGSTTRVFAFDFERLSAADVAASIDEDLKKVLALQVNRPLNSLIVRGTDEAIARLETAVRAIESQLPGVIPKSTKAYPLKRASATVVQQAVRALVQEGVVVGDESSGSLLVTASEGDHKRVAEVIERLDVMPGQQPVVRAYPVRHADPRIVYEMISNAYARNRSVTVSFHPAARSLFVVASPQEHDVFQSLMAELDKPGAPGGARTAKVYALTNVDGEVAAESLSALFEDDGAKIQYNEAGSALVVVGTPDQHQAVEESLRQMEGIEKTLAIFPLRNTDPYVVENAIDDLFPGSSRFAGPSVSSDYDTQRLFVRGTQTQLEQVRQLLKSLGEWTDESGETRGTGDVRSIPFRGDTREAARQIEAIWSRLRPNRIHVISPSDRSLVPEILRSPDGAPRGAGPPERPSPDANPPATKKIEIPIPEEKGRLDPDRQLRAPTSTFRNELIGSEPVRFVAVTRVEEGDAPTESEGKADPPEPASDAAVEPEPPAAPAEPPLAPDTKQPPSPSEKPPIVIVPDEGKITIASPDHEALDQLEALLRAMARSDSASGSQSNFAVFLLRNTGAIEVQQLLRQFFDELPMSRGSLGKIVVVADERLNALIVHGSRKDREVVEELLRVLDTTELPDPLTESRPELVALKNTRARRVLAMLENVYKTQLTSGGGRKPVQIPKGVSSEVATVLQQLNAAAAGPLLTLDVDETTNSIIVRAPPELRKEVRAFIEQLDDQAGDGSNRAVRIIRLENSKSDRMQGVLKEFLLRQPSR
ncbi:MAG: hypothetical protein FJ297_14910 [Planctomycetes bacterium]|nr:hypothetical protein [Planctomycetota bacterium]